MIKYFFVWCLFLFPALSFADSQSLTFTPPITDYSVMFLENIFGVVDGVLHGTGSQIMGSIFSVFNAAVLALGGIVIMYTLIVGTMNTAQDGEMLGKKWASIWVPVRSTIGLALLIPKASGYCLMQISTMWIIVQGIGAADKVWDSALNYLNKGGVIMQAQMDPNTSQQADNYAIPAGASAMLAGEVCMLGLQKQLEAQRESYLDQSANGTGPCFKPATETIKSFCETPVPDFLSSVDFVAIYAANPTQTTPYSAPMPNFSDAPYNQLNTICGTISWKPLATSETKEVSTSTGGGAGFVIKPSSSTTDESTAETTTKVVWDVGNIDTLSDEDISSLQASRPTALQQMFIMYATVAKTMISNDPQITPTTSEETTAPIYPQALREFGVPYLSSGTRCPGPDPECTTWKGLDPMHVPIFMGSEFQDGIADYNAVMAPTVNLINDAKSSSSAEELRGFISKAKEQGWLTAGSYFFDLVHLNGSATEGANQTDTNTGLETSSMSTDSLEQKYTNCDPYDPNANLLCAVLPKDKADAVKTLVGSPIPTQTTLPQSQPVPDPDATTVTPNSDSATVAGFIPNSMLINLPGQPGLQPPVFAMSFNFKLEPSLFRMPKQDFPCGKIFNSGCWGRQLGKMLYNNILKHLFNFFLDTLSQVVNLVIMAVLSVPLWMMTQIFINGVAIIQDPGANPIVALANMGTAYINQAATLWASLLNLTTMFAPVAFIVGPIVMMAAPLVLAWMSVMVAIGFVTAYYIPFLPFMIFTFGVIAWVMVVIEAMVAAPIVALGITHPEGGEAFGKSEHALMILMNVFLRPTMMIIGYIAAIGLCYVSVWIINTGFGHVIQFIQGSPDGSPWKGGTGYTNWAGIYGLFFSVLIYTVMYLIVTEKSFNLIYMLPDQILRWIGSQPEHIGAESARWGEESKQKVTQAGDKSEGAQSQVSKQSAALVDDKIGQVKSLKNKAVNWWKGGGIGGS